CASAVSGNWLYWNFDFW
nr:immunoglobulin heavy chain junction region [Macaca mulatta]MOW75962.1 immunoglobulin heavy chain junction region [Macaca mulatta]MOW76489.1 immunoglobulin heavy chain junction region [Macaca mulatta]MOW76573.1 immunoglobulin heavy chain junction region [Macaca mulatta]MOW76651.1 immunoglobulin heavy chain junction region [Macaca mulatta]